jgi:hypothetical protein
MVDPVHRVRLEQIVADRPLAQRRDRDPFALTGRRRQPGDLGQIGPHRRGGQLADLAIHMAGEPDEVSPVGADRLRGSVRVGQVGEERADVASARMIDAKPLGQYRIHGPSSKLPDN